MDAEEFLTLMGQKDELIARLREYAHDLEEALRQKRGEEAEEQGRARGDAEISGLLYEHGLRRGTLDLRG